VSRAEPGRGTITAPVVLLVDQSTARAGEVFAAALDGNKRAEMIGEHTLGSAAKQTARETAGRQRDAPVLLRYLAPERHADSRERACSPKCWSTNPTSSSARPPDDRRDPAACLAILHREESRREGDLTR
jgi:hypothetical protein